MGMERCVAAMTALLVGCNLVVSLDELQDGAGGAGATASGPSGPGATSTAAAATATAATATAATATVSSGTGGQGPTAYDACVAAWAPVVRLKLADPSADGEPNLGTWGGEAAWTGSVTGQAPLVSGGDGSASFDPDGGLTLDQAGPVFGGFAAFTLELWFRVPVDYDAAVFQVLASGAGSLTVRIQERQDPMGLDSVRFRYTGTMIDRLVIENLDLSDLNVAHHLVAVYRQTAQTMFMGGQADDLVLYVDGATTSLASGTEAPIPDLASPLTWGNGFAGSLDDVAVYDRELPPDVVAALSALGRGERAPCPPP